MQRTVAPDAPLASTIPVVKRAFPAYGWGFWPRAETSKSACALNHVPTKRELLPASSSRGHEVWRYTAHSGDDTPIATFPADTSVRAVHTIDVTYIDAKDPTRMLASMYAECETEPFVILDVMIITRAQVKRVQRTGVPHRVK